MVLLMKHDYPSPVLPPFAEPTLDLSLFSGSWLDGNAWNWRFGIHNLTFYSTIKHVR